MTTNTPTTSTGNLLLDPDTRMTCPNCKHEFSLADGFAKKTLEQVVNSSRGALDDLTKSIRDAETQRLAQKAAGEKQLFEERIKDLEELTTRQTKQHEESLKQTRELEKDAAKAREKALTDQIDTLRSKQQEVSAKEKALSEREQELQMQIESGATEKAQQLIAKEKQQLKDELKEKQDQIAQYQATELELRKEKNKLDEDKAALELDVQRRVDEQRKSIEERTRVAETEKSKFREAGMQKTIDDMSEKLQEAQRKAEQGSQQLQGEVLELILEEQLRDVFPLDVVEPIKKGTKGGDVIQRVMTRSGQLAGSILWEAKRTTAWGKDWCTKLKDDQRAAGAEVSVIVSVVLPKEFPAGQPFGLCEDVWVTSPAAVLPLAEVLRAGLSDVCKQRLIVAGKGEKMEAVYDYLTSPQFAHKLKAVYAAFKKMREELESERTAMQQRWTRREKQIQLATNEIVAIAGDIQGLAHQELPQLELEPLTLEQTLNLEETIEMRLAGEVNKP
jgi:hypothetical protein